jgi:formylglycine-generating enzyme required for sulfatase activity
MKLNGGADPDRHRGSGIKMRFLPWLCWVLLILTSSSAWSQRPARLALVIGNAAYPDVQTPLATTIADAKSLAEELRRSGFEVDLKTNLSNSEFKRAIEDFTSKIKPEMSVLFYFSGFGMQVGRQNYLLPVNAQVWSDADLRRDGINVDNVIAELHRKGAKVKILLLDAARRSYFENRYRSVPEGLASVNAPENTLAMYSAVPGKTIADRAGTNSVFVGELIKEIRVSNLPSAPPVTAEDVFNHLKVGIHRASNREQIPWVASSLVEEFYFGTQTAPPKPQGQGRDTPPPPLEPTTKRDNTPLSYQSELALAEKDQFRECAGCPEMVVVPAGEYMMGSLEDEQDRSSTEGPQHRVRISQRFAVGKLKVTRAEFEKFINETGYSTGDRCFTLEENKAEDRAGRSFRAPGFEQDGKHPVVCINWDDAKAYVAWLSKKTGKLYRLLSESEWEYVARAGTKTPYWWGSSISTDDANYDGGGRGQYRQKTVPADMFKPNPWGLYQVHGNAFEWVEDCWNETYQHAPTDDGIKMAGNWPGRTESDVRAGGCGRHVRRAGAWNFGPKMLRSAYRDSRPTLTRASNLGMRVARTLGQ